MADEKKEGRINIEDLPQAEQELTAEEAREVKGGFTLAADSQEGDTANRGGTVKLRSADPRDTP